MKISLKAARVNAGFTQTTAGVAIGKSRDTVRNWETGRTKIPAEDFLRLCSLYQANKNDIFLPGESA